MYRVFQAMEDFDFDSKTPGLIFSKIRNEPFGVLAGHDNISIMRLFWQQQFFRGMVAICIFAFFGSIASPTQQFDSAAVTRQVDVAVRSRLESIAGYTVTEHYSVFRNKDEVHPVAEMTVNTTYRKGSGKSYAIVSQSGSDMMRRLVLGEILDHEKKLNQPGVREGSLFTSANYEMKLKPGGIQQLDGRDCLALALSPKRKSPNLIEGTLWVDAKTGSIVQVQGTASKSSSFLTGPTHVVRQYADVSGFSQAIHARAESDSFMFGQTIVTIDYKNYQIQFVPSS
jgi:hypothetical protein